MTLCIIFMMSNLALCKCNIGAAPSYEEGASKLFLLAHTPDMLSAGLCAFVVYWFMKYFQKEVAIMKKSNRKLLLKIITSCLIVILFILYFINVFNILVFVSLIAIVLVSFWILLKFIEINEER